MTVRFFKFLALTAILCLFMSDLATPAFASSVNKLSVVGNQVLTNNGEPYVPEGISVYGGMEAADYDQNLPNDNAQIKAAAIYWHANTIRLQAAESNLFTRLKKGENYNHQFMSALTDEINLAHSYGMAVVINDQTEFTNNTPNPTAQTARFWRVMAAQFKNSPYIIFDIFNEPRLDNINPNNTNKQLTPEILYSLFGYSRLDRPRTLRFQRNAPITQAKSWNIWLNGGRVNGATYVGMQTLVDQIRSDGAQNIIWIEGQNEARQLPPNQYLLKGSNLVYALHHPNLNSPTSWNRIGNLAKTQPVVEGEWSQYQSTWAECFSEAYTNAPMYLAYLHAHNIGVIAWSLQANSLLKGDNRIKPSNINRPNDPKRASDLKTPDRLMPNYSCSNKSGQGAGQLLQDYFAKNSMHYDF